MKRNTALFRASCAAGIAGAIGLVVTSAGGVAAPKAAEGGGVAWETITDVHPSYAEGSVGDADGFFTARATASGSGTQAQAKVTAFAIPALDVSGIGVTVTCDAGTYSVSVTGGGAPGVKSAGQTVSLAQFTGNDNAQGTVTFGRGGADGKVGAYIDLSDAIGEGTYIKLGYASCADDSTPTPTSTTGTPTESPTGTPTESPTGTSTGTPTESPTGTPTESPTGTSTGTPTESPTGTPTVPPTSPPGTPTQSPTGGTPTSTPPTGEPTEPPTPTPSTTGLPVTG
ncbi:hypothetical protein [Luteipulveratus halotolerans]|uniref:Uncharacterized protein n=1 Tax=Luteipulveratus halotolerans TaxID=1631356 RepID=A0A0L6CMP3_9MICO|nr:hypothetical protein [Luteipulveratus halotolerans]KNX39056.1 hypothetical protein VV01_21075 [Luteipulveratus halotolerans]